MQRQILPSGRYMPHVSGRSVRRLLRSTTHELGSQTESTCCKKVILTCLARNDAYRGKLGIVFGAHIQDAWSFEFLMHAYMNKHEIAERAFNHPRVQLCVHAGVFTYLWYSSWHSMHACMFMCVYVYLRTHMIIGGWSMYVCACNTHMHQSKSQGRACQSKAIQSRIISQVCRPVQKNSTQNFFSCHKEKHTHTHTCTHSQTCLAMMNAQACLIEKTHTHMHALVLFQGF
jgi:hypothetical protein